MMQGIKVDGKIISCAECGQKVSNDGSLKLNFCPKCGNPLNINASVKYEKAVNHEKLVMLYELIDEVNEGANAVDTINNYISQLNELNK